MARISLYAELLINIRQITVVALLPSDFNSTTFVELSADCKVLTVSHEKELATVKLPAPIQDGFVPPIVPRTVRDLSLRLPIKETAYENRCCELTLAKGQNSSASSLSAETRIMCRSCHALLIKESVKAWKDLPSENWAEMMDFWQCHKPDTHDSRDQHHNDLQKGYGAANVIEPTAGVGLIDVMSVLLLSQDCNLAFEDHSETRHLNSSLGNKKETRLLARGLIDAAADTVAED
ncbi:MAG: hypothetical protein Q9212_001010 [Teloschistes hypoglaucus]